MDIKSIVQAHWNIQATKVIQLPGHGSTLYQNIGVKKGKAITIPPTRIDTPDHNASYVLKAYSAQFADKILYQVRMQRSLRGMAQSGLQDAIPEIVPPLAESSLAGKFGKTDAAKTGAFIAAIRLHVPGFSNDDDDDDSNPASFFRNTSAILLVVTRFLHAGECVSRADATAEHYAALGQFAGKLRKAARVLNDDEVAHYGRKPLVRQAPGQDAQGGVAGGGGGGQGAQRSAHDDTDEFDDDAPVRVHKYRSRYDVISSFLKTEDGHYQMKNNKVLESAVNTFTKNVTGQLFKLHNNEETLWSLVVHNDLVLRNVKFDRDSKYNKLFVCCVFDFDLAQADWGAVEFSNLLLGPDGYGPMQPVDLANIAACWKAYNSALNAGGPLATGIMKQLLDQQTEVEYRLMIEVLRSRLIEEVFRHELKMYPNVILQNAAFSQIKENRKAVLRKFMEDFPPQ